MATLLHLYNPTVRPVDQLRTWDLLRFCTWPRELSVLHMALAGELDMAEVMELHWDDPGDLVTVEQDIEATPELVAELRWCAGPVCAFDYFLPHGVAWSEVPGGSSLGLWCASEDARRAVGARPSVPRVPWRDLASALAERLPPVHVHQPVVAHNHYLEG
jgi:hypothetical protein